MVVGSARLVIHARPVRRLAPIIAVFVAVVGLAASNQAAQKPSTPHRTTSALTDTVILFPAQPGDPCMRYEVFTPINQWSVYNTTFNADTIIGKRFRIEMVASSGVTGVKASVDSQQWIGPSDGTSLTFDLGGTGSHDLSVGLKGSAGSWVDVRVIRVNEPMFVLYPQHLFVKLSPAALQADTFSALAYGETTHTLRVINGSPDGTNRLTSASGTYVKINNSTAVSNTDFSTNVATITRNIPVITQDSIKIFNNSVSGSRLKARVTAVDRTAPVLNLATPASDTVFTGATSVTYAGTVGDETPGFVYVNRRAPTTTPGSFSDPVARPGTYGIFADTIQAHNSANLATGRYRWFVRDTVAPALSVSTPANSPDSTTSASITVSGSWSDLTRTIVTLDGEIVGDSLSGSFSRSYPLDWGMNRITVKATDRVGNSKVITRMMMRRTGDEHSGPSLSAPALSATGVTQFRDAVAFLFRGSGGSPLQTGDSLDTTRITPERAAVVRGHVIGRDYGPIANVTVSVLGHREYGETKTRNDGMFDLVVNGGGQLTLQFAKPNLLLAQRTVEVRANDYNLVDDVGMLGRTGRFTAVDLDAPIVVRGRFASDSSGARDMRLIFRVGTRAFVVKSPGDTAQFDEIRVRATEFTVGDDGPATMPGTLPPASAYTYCVDLRTDEADSVATSIGASYLTTQFTDTVSAYVANFLHFPVGFRVPLGFYDAVDGRWKAEPDAVVLKILGAAGDTALIDSDGNGLADSTAQLAILGLSGHERVQLKAQFAVGDTVWRARMTHFSEPDLNPASAPRNPTLVNNAATSQQYNTSVIEPSLACGSIIECESRVLRERIPLVGSPYTLNYRSSRAFGDKASRTIRIPLVTSAPDPTLRRVILRLDVAGRRLETVDETPNPSDPFPELGWDGTDVYGRPVFGAVEGVLSVGFDYGSMYAVGSGGRSFANSAAAGGVFVATTTDRNRDRITWSRRTVLLGEAGAGSAGLGGWTLGPHHYFDPRGAGTVYYGDGSILPGDRIRPVVQNYAGTTGTLCSPPGGTLCAATGKLARNVTLAVGGMAIAPSGELYVADNWTGSIYRIGQGDTLHRIAGTGTPGSFTSSGNALQRQFRDIKDIAIAPDGSVYFVQQYFSGSTDNVIGRITPNGFAERIIACTGGYVGDGNGVPVGQATIGEPQDIAVAPDGSLFIAEPGTSSATSYRIRRISPDGYIYTHAGEVGRAIDNGATGLATAMGFGTVTDLSVDRDGVIYLAINASNTSNYIRRITPDGVSTATDYGEDFRPAAMALGADGALYISSYKRDGPGAIDRSSNYIYRRDADGTLTIIGGSPFTESPDGDGVLVGFANLGHVPHLAVHPNGDWFYAHGHDNTAIIHRVSRLFAVRIGDEYRIPSPSGSEFHWFDLAGRHVRTRSRLTGAVLYSFRYDAVGRLVSIYDVDGDSTTITRPSANQASIKPPFQDATALSLSSGFLASVVNPNDDLYTIATHTDESKLGLLQSMTDPNEHTTEFEWAELDGRLEEEKDAGGGSQAFALVDSGITRIVTRTTAENRVRRYATTNYFSGTQFRRIRGDDEATTYVRHTASGVDSTVTPEGLTVVDSTWSDRQTGMVAPLPARSRERVPVPGGSMQRSVEVSRSYSPDVPFGQPSGFDPPATDGTFTEVVRVNGGFPESLTVKTTSAVDTVTLRSPMGRLTKVALDAAGRAASMAVEGMEAFTAERDAHGRLTQYGQGDRSLKYGYDSKGRLSFVRDTLHRMTRFAYDDADRCTLQTFPDGRTVGFAYDANGNLTKLRPPGRPAHELAYTQVDLAATYTPPVISGIAAPGTSYEYNLDQQLERVVRPDGDEVNFDYHATKGQLETITTARGLTEITYLATGQVDEIVSPDTVTLAYGYSGPLVTSETWSGTIPGGSSKAVARTYTPRFQDSTETVAGTSTVTYVHDQDGLIIQAGPLSLSRRGPAGKVDSTDVAAGGGWLRSSMDYDAKGDLRNLRYVRSGSDPLLFSQSIARDSLGRIRELQEYAFGTSRKWNYAYDGADRLYEVSRNDSVIARYLYDANGNDTLFANPSYGGTTTSTYDDQDRLRQRGSVQFEYTKAGELLRQISGADTTTFAYDPLGALVSVRFDSGDSVSYTIDGAGRRVGRRWNGSWTGGWLHGYPTGPVAELAADGSVRNRYVYVRNGNGPSLLMRGDTVYRVISDYLGTVRGIADVATGTVVQRRDLDVWGMAVRDSNGSFQSLAFAGGIFDTATGLTRFGARDYDPRIRRWTTKDPIGFEGGDANLYAYVGSNPVETTDPEGTYRKPDCEELLKELIRIANSLNGRIREYNACGYDPGQHDKSIEQLRNKYDKLHEQYVRHCGPAPPLVPLIIGVIATVATKVVRDQVDTMKKLAAPPPRAPYGAPIPLPFPLRVPVP